MATAVATGSSGGNHRRRRTDRIRVRLTRGGKGAVGSLSSIMGRGAYHNPSGEPEGRPSQRGALYLGESRVPRGEGVAKRTIGHSIEHPAQGLGVEEPRDGATRRQVTRERPQGQAAETSRSNRSRLYTTTTLASVAFTLGKKRNP
jgi:hypothetical protein